MAMGRGPSGTIRCVAHPDDPNLFWCAGVDHKAWLPRDHFPSNGDGTPWRYCRKCKQERRIRKTQIIGQESGGLKVTKPQAGMKEAIEAKGSTFEGLQEAFQENLPELGQAIWTAATMGDPTMAKLALELAGRTKDSTGSEEWRDLQRTNGKEAS
jgi:hypothetical protein